MLSFACLTWLFCADKLSVCNHVSVAVGKKYNYIKGANSFDHSTSLFTMQSLNRQLVTLDMLCAELTDYANKAPEQYKGVSPTYLALLKQFCQVIQQLAETAKSYTQTAFVNEISQFSLPLTIKTKRILSVYLRLIEYVIDFYQVSEKIAGIIDTNFDDNAEKRLQLLQVRAIKAKAQFKIVVQALGKREYQQFAIHLALPQADWGWDVLRLEQA